MRDIVTVEVVYNLLNVTTADNHYWLNGRCYTVIVIVHIFILHQNFIVYQLV